MSKDLKWMLVLILAIASGAYWFQSRPLPPTGQPLHLQLMLGTDPQFTQKFVLTLERNRSGAGFDTMLSLPGAKPPFDHHGAMDGPTFEKLQLNLAANGLWTLPSGQEAAPEDTVLYTRLSARQGAREHTSQWRGLPTQQHRDLANCLMQSPMGNSINQALQALSAAKTAKP